MFDQPRYLSDAELESLLAHRDWVQRLARGLVADVHRADDVAQASWLSVLRHPPRHAANLRAWLSMLVRDTARSMQRAEMRRDRHEREAVREREVANASDAVERAELANELSTAVLALREPYKTVLVLAYLESLSPSEIAERLGVPASSVRTRIQRGLAQLKAELERKHEREHWLPALLVLAKRPAIPIVTGGAVLMSMKLKVALAAAVVAAVGLWLWHGATPAPLEANRVTTVEPRAAELASKPADIDSAPSDVRAVVPQVSAPPSAATDGSLRVEVVWEKNGSRAPDVGVLLSRTGAFGHLERLEGTTDADGVFFAQHLHPGGVLVSIDRGGEEVAQVVVGAITTVRIAIPHGVRVQGIVVDSESKPVAGASIWLSYRTQTGENRRVGTSDAAGRFEIDSISAHHFLSARMDSFAPSYSISIEGHNDSTIELQLVLLGRGGSCKGIVFDKDDKAVAAAEVWLGLVRPHLVTLPDGTRAESALARCWKTDADGHFRADDLALGPTDILVIADGFARYAASIDVRVDEAADVQVHLGQGALVRGVVKDTEGLPASDVKIEIDRYGLAAYSRVRTEVGGAFRIEAVPAGKHAIFVDGESRGRLRATVEVRDGEELVWNAALDRGLVISGKVLDESEHPLEGWIVSAQPTSDEVSMDALNRTGEWRTRTDAEGRFLICNLEASDAKVEVRRPKSPGDHPLVVVEEVKPGTRDLVVHVTSADAPSAFVHGLIVDESGKPIGDAELSFYMVPINLSGSATILKSDAGTGAFRFGPVPAGTYRLDIKARGLVLPDLGELTVNKRDDLDLHVIRLEPAGSVCVKLSRDGGGPIGTPSLQVRADGVYPTELTLMGDRARCETLAPGRYTLFVRNERGIQVHHAFSFDVVKGQQTDIDVELPAEAKR